MSYREKIKAISVAYSQREKKQFNPSNQFYYIVPMFPYPSGNIHMGHIRNYSISNVVAQYKKYKGIEVFHPIGFDSFGMPAENAAIKKSISPSVWTESNIAQMTQDFKDVGFDFDWDHQVQTHKFDYYKFEQEIFRKAWNAGIIYKKDKYVNYDPDDKTVLSNEQVINGFGWRTGAKVIRKKIPMYFFDMKKYAKRLNDDLIYCSSWPKKVVEMQKNWIGYEDGKEYIYSFGNSKISIYKSPKVKEVNAVIIGINNYWVKSFENKPDFNTWIEIATQGGVSEKENFKKKIQFFTGQFVIFENKTIPCFIDINMDDEAIFTYQESINDCDCYEAEIGEFVEEKMATFIKLKDWCISRQRYWGNPIPVIYCDDCGDVISPEDVRLPVDMIPDGIGNVLTRNESFVNCECPCCGKPAKRCTDTMDTFVQSSWYFHRYINPHSPEMIDKKDTKINHYIGGVEHATMHLIYTRFFQKMMYDFGMVTQIEPIEKLTTQGMVCKKYQKEDGTFVSSKMSKSIGNIVEPKPYIEKYGADAVQMFMIFAGPPDQNFDFEDDGIIGSYRFIEDVYNYFCIENKASKSVSQQECINAINRCESYIDKEFNGRFNLNTTVPQVMIAFKTMKKTIFTDSEVKNDVEKRFIKIFGIFAPQTSHYITMIKK